MTTGMAGFADAGTPRDHVAPPAWSPAMNVSPPVAEAQ